MRKRFTRVIVFINLLLLLGVGFNFVAINFSGDGKTSPEEALPDDANYIWIDGPKNEREQRYFFLLNSHQFGTQVVSKNLQGWSTGNRISSSLPNPLAENTLTAAYSDSEILFGLIKPSGNVKVMVNGHPTKRIALISLSKEVTEKYEVEGYEIWYIDLSQLTDINTYLIKVLDENNSLLNELSI